jgi:hypothetical protein
VCYFSCMQTVSPPATRRSVRVALWILAVVVAVGSAAYQRLTGPTVSLRGQITLDGASHRYRLPRSGVSTTDHAVGVPRPAAILGGALEYRRLRSDDAWQRVAMVPEGDRLVGHLPRQPAAGKLEYSVILQTTDGERRLPEGRGVVIRFKNPVPAWLLIPHVILMFTALLVGTRAGLGALWAPEGLRRLTLVTVGTLTVGGLILGPIVQKLAFEQLWAGFPFGKDFTDDKTLIMWLVWVAAAVVICRARAEARRVRAAALVAAVVMLGIYLVPHSVRGSELDYRLVDQGVAPAEAVTTGR